MKPEEINAKILRIMELALEISPVGVKCAYETHKPCAIIDYGGHCSVFGVRLYDDAADSDPSKRYDILLCRNYNGDGYLDNPEVLDEIIAEMTAIKEKANDVG